MQEFVAQNGNSRTLITIHAPDEMPLLPAAVEVAAYRIGIEAVTNTIRHANAQACTVRLALNDHLRLEIDDDGDGLPDPVQPGVGLSSMHERAIELGGTFEVKSQPGNGTQIVVTLPIRY
jgi:signal transduction histidine kinase